MSKPEAASGPTKTAHTPPWGNGCGIQCRPEAASEVLTPCPVYPCPCACHRQGPHVPTDECHKAASESSVPPEVEAVLRAALASHGRKLQFPTEATLWHAVEAWIVAGRPGLPREKP
jgi:hypothetical protein